MKTIETLSIEEATRDRNTAIRQFRCDWAHGNTRDERENCCACCLNGYEPRGGFEEGYSVRRDGPNVAGWERLWIEAYGYIPAKWHNAFKARIKANDNTAYIEALKISVATFAPKYLKYFEED